MILKLLFWFLTIILVLAILIFIGIIMSTLILLLCLGFGGFYILKSPFTLINMITNSSFGKDSQGSTSTYVLKNGSVRLSLINGNVVINTHQENTVIIDVIKIGEKKYFDDVLIAFDAPNDSQLIIESKYLKDNINVRTDYTITVPENLVDLYIETINASIVINNASFISNISTVNGSITAKNIQQPIIAQTTNGEIITSLSESINKYSLLFTTVNGAITLSIPHTVMPSIIAKTTHGNIKSNIYGESVKQFGSNSFTSQGEKDSASIIAKTINGAITIRLM